MEMCPTTHSYAHLAHSSVGQSSGLIIRRSWDHAPLGPLRSGLQQCKSFFFCLLTAVLRRFTAGCVNRCVNHERNSRSRLLQVQGTGKQRIPVNVTGYKRPKTQVFQHRNLGKPRLLGL